MRLIIRKTVYLQKTVIPMYIHEHKEWPYFSWNKELVGEKLNKVNKAVGYPVSYTHLTLPTTRSV